MKNITLLLLLLTSYFAHAQWTADFSVNIVWEDDGSSTSLSETIDNSIKYLDDVNSPIKGNVSTTITILDEEIVSDDLVPYDISKESYSYETILQEEGSIYTLYLSLTPWRKKDNVIYRLKKAIVKCNISNNNGPSRGPTFKNESVLKAGTFAKVGIADKGVYSISGQDLVDNTDININSVNPNNIKVWVGHPHRLPKSVSTDRIDDLVESPSIVTGADDGSFDTNDQILFYAEGPSYYYYDTVSSTYIYDKNPFSTYNYVYIQVDGAEGTRLQNQNTPTEVATHTSSTYDYFQYYHEDAINLLGSYQSAEGTGQRWFAEYFGLDNEQSFTDKFDFTGVVADVPSTVSYAMASRSQRTTQTVLNIDGNEIQNNYSSVNLSDVESQYAQYRTGTADFLLSGTTLPISINYSKLANSDEAWLDYITILSKRQLADYNEDLLITDKESLQHTVAEFDGNLSTNTNVWNVTDLDKIHSVPHQNGRWSYNTNDKLQQFYVFDNPKSPESITNINNQNLHSIDEGDMIIIYSDEFQNAVNRLATHRAQHDGLDVKTVLAKDIYNEYSSGKLDPTAIRDFVKMVHQRTDNFRYLLLFGDASFDYRGLTIGLPDHNFVPTYETPESLHPINGFPTDDFYGLLSDSEGGDLRGGLDVSIGRIPVQSVEEAEQVVDKIIRYDSGTNRLGDWRINVGFSADDEDNNKHFSDSDKVAKDMRERYPQYDQQKVYFDAFEQISTPGGDRYYDASTSINSNIQGGQLIQNYLGHGGPKGWSQERVLKLSDIDTWDNADHMPLLITATCTFTGYDDPNIISAGEYAFRKKEGGCIALYTTVRAVFANDNKRLVDGIFETIFELDDDYKPRRLGDIMRVGKNSITTSGNPNNARKFTLIGDPAMRLALPTEEVVTTHINAMPVTEGVDTLHALDEVTIKGMITDRDGNILSDFNGTVYPTVYDKESTIETLGNDSKSQKAEFEVFKNILFKGAASVENGQFEFSFIVPKDINYSFGKGRISYYADDNESRDAAGYFEDVVIGGSSENISDDNEGPLMEVFMNDRSFKDGTIIDKNSTLLVYLNDDTGINVSGTSIGHDLTATLDEGQSFILNDFYESNINDFSSGVATYPMDNLEVGTHTLTVKAWDLSNNSTSATITFEVVESLEELINPYVYPNPVHDISVFSFEHNQLGVDSQVDIMFYNNLGQHVDTYSKRLVPTGNRTEIMVDLNETKLGDFTAGLYFYKINMLDIELNTLKQSKFEKIVKDR